MVVRTTTLGAHVHTMESTIAIFHLRWLHKCAHIPVYSGRPKLICRNCVYMYPRLKRACVRAFLRAKKKKNLEEENAFSMPSSSWNERERERDLRRLQFNLLVSFCVYYNADPLRIHNLSFSTSRPQRSLRIRQSPGEDSLNVCLHKAFIIMSLQRSAQQLSSPRL